MSKLINYQDCMIDSQAKIALEALMLKAKRQSLTLTLRYASNTMIDICGDGHFEKTKICHFLKKEAPKYGFLMDPDKPWRLFFVGLKQTIHSN